MGFDLDYFLNESGEEGDFKVLEFCIRPLTDDYMAIKNSSADPIYIKKITIR